MGLSAASPTIRVSTVRKLHKQALPHLVFHRYEMDKFALMAKKRIDSDAA